MAGTVIVPSAFNVSVLQVAPVVAGVQPCVPPVSVTFVVVAVEAPF